MSGPVRPTPRGGYTLVDIMLALALLGTFLGVLFAAMVSGFRTVRSGIARAGLQTSGGRAIARIGEELRQAGAAGLVPDPTAPFGSDVLDFQTITGVDEDGPLWGTTVRFAFEYAPGETDDGTDENGNGLVDDGVLVRIEDPGGPAERRVVLTGNVRELLEGEDFDGDDDNGNGLIDERGLSFVREDEALTVRLCLERIDDEEGSLVRSFETTVLLRN